MPRTRNVVGLRSRCAFHRSFSSSLSLSIMLSNKETSQGIEKNVFKMTAAMRKGAVPKSRSVPQIAPISYEKSFKMLDRD